MAGDEIRRPFEHAEMSCGVMPALTGDQHGCSRSLGVPVITGRGRESGRGRSTAHVAGPSSSRSQAGG
jgi:hypothetical protein